MSELPSINPHFSFHSHSLRAWLTWAVTHTSRGVAETTPSPRSSPAAVTASSSFPGSTAFLVKPCLTRAVSCVSVSCCVVMWRNKKIKMTKQEMQRSQTNVKLAPTSAAEVSDAVMETESWRSKEDTCVRHGYGRYNVTYPRRCGVLHDCFSSPRLHTSSERGRDVKGSLRETRGQPKTQRRRKNIFCDAVHTGFMLLQLQKSSVCGDSPSSTQNEITTKNGFKPLLMITRLSLTTEPDSIHCHF